MGSWTEGGLDIQLLDGKTERVKVSIFGEPGWEVTRRDMVETATPTMVEYIKQVRELLRSVVLGQGDDFMRGVALHVNSWFEGAPIPRGVLVGDGYVVGSAHLINRATRNPLPYVDIIRWMIDAVADMKPELISDDLREETGNDWLEEAAHCCTVWFSDRRKDPAKAVLKGRKWMGHTDLTSMGSVIT